MKQLLDYKALVAHVSWQHREDILINSAQRVWLHSDESLTQQLIDYSEDNFELQLLSEVKDEPYPHESLALGFDVKQQCHIREVLLKCHGQATVYARSIISDEAITASKQQLAKLGNIPLGHLLFKNGKADIETRQIAKIDHFDKSIFARRTLYELNGENILVSEFFLQEVWNKI